LQALERATTFYKGDLLPSCYDEWIIPHRERYHQANLNALEHLIRLLEENHDYHSAIQNAQRLLRYDPLHESTYRDLIRLHAVNGDRASALRVYHTCTTILQRELDVMPSIATIQAYEKLLGAKGIPVPSPLITTSIYPLVGREVEWAQMLQVWRDNTLIGKPHALIISGEAGIGKSRLLDDLIQWTTRQGITSTKSRCYAAEGELAYAPVTAWFRSYPLASLPDVWLAEISRLLPEILIQRPDLPQPLGLTDPWQRERLFEALAHGILGLNHPLILTMDDLQWCDRDSLEWLHYLLRFDPEARLLFVGAYRPEEIGENHPLLSFLQALRFDKQVTEIELQPLDEAATQILATHVAGVKFKKETFQRLFQETEGNPLFVVETVRAELPFYNQFIDAGTTGKILYASQPFDIDLPPKVKSVLEVRLAQLTPPTRELAEVAATIGREFTFKLLAKVCDRDENTLVRQLDEMWRRRIVREHGVDAYDFSHDKLREVAYRKMSSVRRRLLHRLTAEALEALHAGELDTVSYQVAVHYDRANLHEKSITYYLRAAKAARQIFANEEAASMLQRALLLLKEDMTTSGERIKELKVEIWEEKGDILELTTYHEKALQAYLEAQKCLSPTDQLKKTRLYRKIGTVKREQRRYAEALETCQRAEISLGEQPDMATDAWWDEWLEVQVDKVWAHYWMAQWQEMELLVHKVEPVVQRRGNSTNRMRFLMASCLMHLRKERYIVSDEMLANSNEVLAASQVLGSMKTRIECHFEFGFLNLWRRELDKAEKYLKLALDLAEKAGVLPYQTLSLTYLTVLYRFRGQINLVQDYTHRAKKAAENAQMPDYVAAGKGNQAWIAFRKQDILVAEQIGREALEIWERSPLVYPFQWQALWPLIAVAQAQNQEQKSFIYIRALLDSKQQLLPDKLNDELEHAIQAQSGGKPKIANFHLEQAQNLAREMGYL
jgi:hypothetical protein